MARMTKRKKEQFERYKKAYGNLSQEQLESLWDYDEHWCGSDEDCREYLLNELTTEYVDEKEIEDSFYKAPKTKPTLTKAEIKKNTAKTKAAQSDRLDTLVEGLKAYDFLFGALVERTNTELKYNDPETGKGITIKIAKHKVQKVVSKTIKRKPVKLDDGTEEEAPFTSVELRSMAIENIMLANPELFEAPSFAGTQMGFVNRDAKYPFGSIKMTHHKD